MQSIVYLHSDIATRISLCSLMLHRLLFLLCEQCNFKSYICRECRIKFTVLLSANKTFNPTKTQTLICVSNKLGLETRAKKGKIPQCVCGCVRTCVFFFSQHHSMKESLKANDTCVPQTKCYCVNYNYCWKDGGGRTGVENQQTQSALLTP